MSLAFTFFHVLIFSSVYCDRSFTFVLDTTNSMQEELDVVKVNIASAFNTNMNPDISNYIVVPFNEPGVGEPIVTQAPRDFINAIYGMSVSGEHPCPEKSLSGVEKALEISKPQSTIFLFTDAFSKDAGKLSSIENLCRSTRSQVMIFLTGQCTRSPDIDIQVYYDVAKACAGAVVLFHPATLRQAFFFIKEVISVQWTEISTYDTFTEYKQLSFSVDTFTKTVLIVVSGEHPTLEISTPDGSSRAMETLLNLIQTQVVRLSEPSIGEHTVVIRCKGKTSVTLYKRNELPFRFGFSTKRPRSMSETSKRPMPGRINYIIIDVSQAQIELETVQIQIANNQEKKGLVLEDINGTDLYLTNTFIEPDKPFRIWVKGYDTSRNQQIHGASEIMIPQQTGAVQNPRWMKPKSKILDSEPMTVDFGTKAIVACEVIGYPAPSIIWEDDNMVTLPSEEVLLEIPSLYISYATIENAKTNTTIYCKSKNSVGEDSQSIRVYVYRPFSFDVIQTPADQAIEYGSEGKLYCKVSAYPEAETKWYHNDSAVLQSDDVEVDGENALWIKNMTLKNIGNYKCEVSNEANIKTFSAFVSITGIEAPQVDVEKTNIVLKLEDWSSLECRIVKGKPVPVITWTYKSEDGYEFGNLPDSVISDDGKLKIASAQNNHKGTYRCTAANILGQHTVDITVKLQYAPVITNSDPQAVVVKEEDDVVLPCNVDASPVARVRWEMSQDDVIVALDARHRTDERHTHRFQALWKDSGNYHCIAENDVGVAEKTVTVNVLVPPYIDAPKSKTMVVRAGNSIVLMCNVLYGNPVPATKWEFIAPDSTTKVLSRHNSSHPLHLNDVNHAHGGSYLCIADNDVGTDSIKIYVKIE